MTKNVKKLLTSVLTLSIATVMTGCASKPNVANQVDPYEKMNRFVFAFNQDVDHLVLRPATNVYTTLVPSPLRMGVSNVFDNLEVLTTFPNDLLQGNFKYLAVDFWRFSINAIFGIGGLFDVASHMGIPKHEETFGMTFAKWRGGRSAPYLVLPLLGPSTVQNAFGVAADITTQPWFWINGDTDAALKYSGAGLRILNERAKYMAGNQLVDNAFDPYTFVRDAYLQNDRRAIAKNEALGSNTASEQSDIPSESPAELPNTEKEAAATKKVATHSKELSKKHG